MDFLAALSSQPVLTLPAFLFVLTVVVFFHELGHFAVARWCGVDVEAFSIGFGRELMGFNDRKGTRWKLCLIPLGGYVKFSGDENAASVPDHEKVAAMSAAQRAGPSLPSLSGSARLWLRQVRLPTSSSPSSSSPSFLALLDVLSRRLWLAQFSQKVRQPKLGFSPAI